MLLLNLTPGEGSLEALFCGLKLLVIYQSSDGYHLEVSRQRIEQEQLKVLGILNAFIQCVYTTRYYRLLCRKTVVLSSH